MTEPTRNSSSVPDLPKSLLPAPLHGLARRAWYACLKCRYRTLGRPAKEAESAKARPRREREGFFEKYCTGNGIDIGYGGDLLCSNCEGWDFEHGDAEDMQGVPDDKYDFVYSSHTLEDLESAEAGLRNWWRILKKGGHLILYLPERDLFEKRRTLPSRWNRCHRRMFLLDRDDPPDTIGVLSLIDRALSGHHVVYSRICDEGHTITDPEVHSDGEYSIEVVIRKGE